MYTAYFGFRSLPFNGSASLDELYESAAFLEAHRVLREGVERGERLMLLTGVPGVGKTTLLRKLRASLESNGYAVIASDGSCGTEELIESFRASLELVTELPREGELGDGAHERTANGARPGVGVVLMVDGGDSLPGRAFQRLLELSAPGHGDETRMTVIATGLPGLDRRLMDLDFPARGAGVALCCSLAPLGRREVRAYVRRKLDTAGYEGPELFSDDALQALADHGCGIPKRIETLCGMALLIAFDADRRTVDGATVAEAVADLEGLAWETTPPPGQDDSDRQALDPDRRPSENQSSRTTAAEAARALARRLSASTGRGIAALVSALASAGRATRNALASDRQRVAHDRRHAASRGYAFGPALHGVFETARVLIRRLSAATRSGFAVLFATAALAARGMRNAWRAVWQWVSHGLRRVASRRSARRRARHEARAATSRRLEPAPERDWLTLKVGFAGVLMIAPLAVAIVILLVPRGDAPTRSDSTPVQSTRPGDDQPGSETPLWRRHEQQLALLQGRFSRLERLLEQTMSNMNDQEELIAQQQARIEQLRKQARDAESRLAAAGKSTAPVSVVLPNTVLSMSTPTGEVYEFGPTEISEKPVHQVQIRGRVEPDTAELLKKLAAHREAVEPGIDTAVVKASSRDGAYGFASGARTSVETRRLTFPMNPEALVVPSAAPGSDDPGALISALESTPPQGVVGPAKADAADGVSPAAIVDAVPSGHSVVEAAASPAPESASASLAESAEDALEDALEDARGGPAEGAVTESAGDGSTQGATLAAAAASAESVAERLQERLPPVEDRSIGVPAPRPEAPTVSENVAPVDRQSAATEKQSSPESKPHGMSATEKGGHVYEVVAGDTLSEISRRFDVKVAELREWNGLTSDRLNIGQLIRLAPAEALDPESNEELLAAAREGRLAELEQLLDAGAAIDGRDTQGKSALMHAAAHGHFAIVELLIARGADVNLRSKSGDSALSFAAWNGEFLVLAALLRRGAKVEAVNHEGQTALMFASINGHERCVRRLLDGGANVNARSDDLRTALSAAVWNGHARIARMLLDSGANVNERGRDGWTVLMEAAWNGQADLVDLLLEHGADPKAKSDTGLTPAAAAKQQGHSRVAAAISRSVAGSS